MASASRIAQALRDIAAALENLQDSEREKVSEPEHSSETTLVPPTPLASHVARGLWFRRDLPRRHPLLRDCAKLDWVDSLHPWTC